MQARIRKILSLVLCMMMVATIFTVAVPANANDETAILPAEEMACDRHDRSASDIQDEDEACRFWGIIGDPAPSDVIENHLLGDPPNYNLWPNCLKRLGGSSGNFPYNNFNGWGLGYYSRVNTSTVLRGIDPAWEDPDFDWAVRNTVSASPDIVVGHVRRSTNVVDIANPHPFERYRMGRWWLFGHNGGVNKGTLRNLITGGQPSYDYFQAHPEDLSYCYCQIGDCGNQDCECTGFPSDPDMCLYDGMCGLVDSELYFIYLLKCIEQEETQNWMAKVWNGTRQAVNSGIGNTLNFFLSDGETLWGYREGRSLYYNDSLPGYCAIASTPPNPSPHPGWTEMDDEEMCILRKDQEPCVGDIDDPCPLEEIPTPPTQQVWPEYAGYMAMTAPVLADFDPYYPGIEIISGGGGGRGIFVWHEDGTSMNKWSPKILGELVSPHSPPALGDLDGDELLDLVIVAGTDVFAFNARDDQLWNQEIEGNVTSPPVLADLDNDDDLEVLVSSKDGNLYIWNHDGTVFDPGGNPWPRQTDEILYRPPAVGNLDEDSDLEIVVGGGGAQVQAPFHVFVWNIDGSNLNDHWPMEIPDGYWACTPSLADIDQDERIEIVMGVGHDVDNGRVYAWEPSNGSTVSQNWPRETDGYPFWCPISDLDPEYQGLEIVTSIRYDNRTYAWHYDGSDVTGWPYIMGGEGGHSPAIGDIDGDESLEIVVGSYDSMVYAIRSNGTNVSGWPKETGYIIQTSPAIGDIDNDEITEIVQPSSDKYVYLWEVINNENVELHMTWPMLQHDERHSGSYHSTLPFQDGWPVELENWIFSDLVTGDIDNDYLPEVVVGDLKLHVLNHDGTEANGWPVQLDQHVMSSPALADIDNDLRIEIIVGTYYTLYAFEHDGNLKWSIPIDRYSRSDPSIGDIDDDGDLEIVMGCTNSQGDPGGVYVWDHEGVPVPPWPKIGIAVSLSSPALVDLDNDEDLEIVIGARNGYVYAWHHDGTDVPGWPQYVGDEVYSSPAVGDVDGDGDLEIAAGSSSGYMYLWHHNGAVADGWPQRTPIGDSGFFYRVSHPALGDLDSDGDVEIVVPADVTVLIGIPEPIGKVFAWHHDGSLVEGWPVPSGDEWVTTCPLIADIDTDGDIEVITVSDRPDCVHAWHHDGAIVDGFPLFPEPGSVTDMRATPVIDDLDGDGDIELIAASYDTKVYAWDLSGRYDTNRIEWGVFHANVRHTGRYGLMPWPIWPMFHRDARNTGYSPGIAPDTNKVRWFHDLGEWVYGSAVVWEDKVFVPGYKNIHIFSSGSDALINVFPLEGVLTSSLAVAYGKIFFGLRNGKIYALDANDGSQIWEYATEGPISYSSPTVKNGKVFIGSEDHKVYALDEDGFEDGINDGWQGEPSEGKGFGDVIWYFEAPSYVQSTPAVADGYVFVGSRKALHVLNEATGKELWRYDADVFSSPSVANNRIFFVSYPDAILHCLDKLTGDEIWSVQVGASPATLSSPSIAYGKVFVASSNSGIFAYDMNNGQLIWSLPEYPMGVPIGTSSSPAIADGKVYIGIYYYGYVLCLDAETGAVIWGYSTDTTEVRAPPAIADGKVFVGSLGGVFYCFGPS